MGDTATQECLQKALKTRYELYVCAIVIRENKIDYIEWVRNRVTSYNDVYEKKNCITVNFHLKTSPYNVAVFVFLFWEFLHFSNSKRFNTFDFYIVHLICLHFSNYSQQQKDQFIKLVPINLFSLSQLQANWLDF